jgi:hypothetical protein
MLNGTKTFQQSMQQLVKSILDSIIDFLAKWVTQWATTQLANLAASKTSAAASISTQSGVAGASGIASMAGAPYPLDMAAPAFGAAMAAEAAGFAAISAEGGYDVPSGIAPRAQLHPREMVLNSELADGIRALIASNSGGNRGSVGHNFFIRTNDARSFERSLGQGGALARSLTKLHGSYAR